MHNMFDVSGKIVVITGGLGQLGRQFVKTFQTLGAHVAVIDLDDDIREIQSRFAPFQLSDTVKFFKADITDRAALESVKNKINSDWGPVSVLINNAALDSPPGAPAEENGPFETYPADSFDKVLEVNLKGMLLCCQVFGGEMAKNKLGSIINISSTYGLLSPDQRIYEYRRRRGEVFYKPVAYAVSKSGVLNLTRYLATYWAASGVRVNTLSFAGVYNNQDSEFLKEYTSRVPLGRMAREDEYNGAVVFLASDASSYMTGSNLIIDGGWTAW